MKVVLQVALDLLNEHRALAIARDSVKGGADWLEAGTPLIKSEGMDIIRKLKEKFPGSDVSIRKLTDLTTGRSLGVLIEISDIKATDLEKALEDLINFKLNDQNFSIEEVGSALGASFFKEMIRAIIFAFIFMAIVVFVVFRKFIPSLAVILSVLVEMLTAIAVLDLLHIKVSTAGIAAILMVMGYSIDTDILLTTRILKRTTGTLFERFKGSVKTGVMMTTTTIVALSIGYIITNSAVIKQMFLIILIALFVDMITTWIMNSSLLIWYCKKHNIK